MSSFEPGSVAKSLCVVKFNPYHDEKGQFAPGGGGGEEHLAAAAAHREAASAHRAAAKGGSVGHAKSQSQKASDATRTTGAKPFVSQAANAYSRMAANAKAGSTGAKLYHTEAGKSHEAAAKWHESAHAVLNPKKSS